MLKKISLDNKLFFCYYIYKWCVILVITMNREDGAKNPLKGHIDEVP